MLMVLVSRILGLVRDRLLSGRFLPDELGVYFAAFRLPNFLFELLVTGAITAAFIPVFSRLLTEKKAEKAWQMTAVLINLSLVVLLLIMVPILIFTREISAILAPGFSERELSTMVNFTRFMLMAQVLPLMIGNYFVGVLQSFSLFFLPAIAPVVYNLGIITGIVIFSPQFGLFGAVLGVGLGAGLFLAIQLPLVWKLGWRPVWRFDIKTPGVLEVLRLMAPRTFSLTIAQIDTTVDLMLASLLGTRMITIFNFAQQLQLLPIGVFGVTIAQAALPTLSQNASQADYVKFKTTIITAAHQMLFFVLPAAALFMVLRIPIVRLVFGAARFDWQATVLTGQTLSMFSISLFAQALSQLLARGFFALYDSRTPMIIGIGNIFFNTLLSIVFIQVLGWPIWALGLSTSVASILQVSFLYIFLSRRVGGFSALDTFLPVAKMLVAAATTGLALYVPLKLFDQLIFDTTRVFGLLLLTGMTGTIGISCYLFLSWVLGVGEVKPLFLLFNKLRRQHLVLFNPVSELTDGEVRE